jgi:P27 family predicted phage terminase small subunit
MGRKPGPLRQSRATARLHGVRADPPGPVVASNAPRMPAGLGAEEQRIWRWLVRQLAERAVPLAPCDMPAMRDYCLCTVRLRETEDAITRDGAMIAGRQGGLVKHPLFAVAAGYRNQLARLGSLFGLTPGDRARLDLPAPEAADGRTMAGILLDSAREEVAEYDPLDWSRN